jgi:hypothetical protein
MSKLFSYMQKPRKCWTSIGKDRLHEYEDDFAMISGVIPYAALWDVQNIYDYVRQSDPMGINDALLAEDGGLIPPWDLCWLEWDNGSQIIGTLLTLIAFDENPDLDLQGAYPEASGTVDMILYAWDHQDEYPSGPALHITYAIDDQGHNIGAEDSRIAGYFREWDGEYKELTEESKNYMFGWTALQLVMFACKLANCRNVVMQEILPTRQVRRYLQRQGEPVLVRHVLEIGGPQKKHELREKGEGRQMQKRLHICRGHFATYDENAPRFGRAKDGVGRFWISPHVRGSIDQGAVLNDYVSKKVS